jgi:hypothetical protein
VNQQRKMSNKLLVLTPYTALHSASVADQSFQTQILNFFTIVRDQPFVGAASKHFLPEGECWIILRSIVDFLMVIRNYFNFLLTIFHMFAKFLKVLFCKAQF